MKMTRIQLLQTRGTKDHDAAVSNENDMMLMTAMTIAKMQLVQSADPLKITKRTTTTITTRTVLMVVAAGARGTDGESCCVLVVLSVVFCFVMLSNPDRSWSRVTLAVPRPVAFPAASAPLMWGPWVSAEEAGPAQLPQLSPPTFQCVSIRSSAHGGSF